LHWDTFNHRYGSLKAPNLPKYKRGEKILFAGKIYTIKYVIWGNTNKSVNFAYGLREIQGAGKLFAEFRLSKV